MKRPWPLRRRRPVIHVSDVHPGIRLRVSVPSGVVVDASAERLYYSARYGMPPSASCTPACLPDCDDHGWFNLIAGEGVESGYQEFSTVPLKIEIKPIQVSYDE